MCKILELSRSGYYSWLKRSESARAKENRSLVVEIAAVHKKSRETYGSPRIHDELIKKNVKCSKNRVARLMNKNHIKSVHSKRFKPQTTDSKHQYQVPENILDQDFTATAPNQKWVGDITYIWTSEGWLYLAVVLDLFSRKVVGWSVSKSPDAELVCNAFMMAEIRRGKPKNFIYHSDRGSQYASLPFRDLLQTFNVTLSMSRKGNCYDNAVIESFFHTLKVELVHRCKFVFRTAARRQIADYIENFYNTFRSHSSIGYCSPCNFEDNFRAAA
jgi:transposase InsO family protein